jgi:hypothetical protein
VGRRCVFSARVVGGRRSALLRCSVVLLCFCAFALLCCCAAVLLFCCFSRKLIFCGDEGIYGCFFDDRGDLIGMRDEDEVAAFDLRDFASCPLAHEVFERGLDGVVFRSDDVPGRFGAPGRLAKDIAEGGCSDGNLCVGHEGGFVFRNVGAKSAMVFGYVIPHETILWRIDTIDGIGWIDAQQGAERIAFVGREGRHIDQSGYFGVMARRGDDRAAIGVADEDAGAVLSIEDAFGGRDVVFESGVGVANYADFIASPL